MKNLSFPSLNLIRLRFVMTLFSVLMFSSCEEREDHLISLPGPGTPGSPGYPGNTVPTPAPTASSFAQMASYFDSRMSLGFTSTEYYMRRYGDIVVHNYESFVRNEARQLAQYLSATWFPVDNFARDLDLQNTGVVYTGTPVLFSNIPGISQAFSISQLSILDNYIADMYNATSQSSATTYFNHAVTALTNNLKISNEGKIEARAILEAANKLAQRYFGGSSTFVIGDISGVTGQSALANCKVSWRHVWAGAVIGGAVGAVKGAVIGASGGTVVFPGLGTATGGVGGAVIGGALGFTGGAFTGIVAELLTSCFRAANYTMANRDCSIYVRMEDRVQCEYDNRDRSLQYKITI